MRSVLPLVVCALLVTAVPAQSAEERVIGGNVSAGGVMLGGLTVSAAADKLGAELRPALAGDLVVRAAGSRFVVPPSTIGFTLDAERTAVRAANAGTPPAPLDVGLVTSVDPSAVDARAAAIVRAVSRSPRSARLTGISSRTVTWTRSRPGRTLTRRTVTMALTTAAAKADSRQVRVEVGQVAPAVTDGVLRARYPAIVTIDKRSFTLRLFRGLKMSMSFRIAHGMPAYPTPSGRFRINSKQVNPIWYVPSAPWAGALAGTVVPGGAANNPLKARWMGLVGGIGIHGTADEGSIGTRASHGCIRMRVRDVKRLFRLVRVGTPVVIG